jgi:hypothetical protein
MEKKQDELAKLHQSAVTLEAQRAILGDEAVDTALAAIRSQVEALGGTAALPAVQSDTVYGDKMGGDKIGGDKAEGNIYKAQLLTIYQNAPGQPQLDPEGFNQALNRYLDWVVRRYGRLNLRGIERRSQMTRQDRSTSTAKSGRPRAARPSLRAGRSASSIDAA